MNKEIDWSAVIELARSHCCATRLKVLSWDPSDWSATVLMPAPDYIELPAVGPVRMRDVEYFDVRVKFQRQQGRYGSPIVVDASQPIISVLEGNGASYNVVEDGTVVRIFNPSRNREE